MLLSLLLLLDRIFCKHPRLEWVRDFSTYEKTYHTSSYAQWQCQACGKMVSGGPKLEPQSEAEKETASKETAPGMQSEEGWTWLKGQIRSGALPLIFEFSSTCIGGVYVLQATSHLGVLPYGWLWYRQETGRVLSILECYVPVYLRRCGVLTALLKHLLKDAPETRMVVTGRATEFSRPWLEKQGFVFNTEMDRWELTPAPAEKESD